MIIVFAVFGGLSPQCAERHPASESEIDTAGSSAEGRAVATERGPAASPPEVGDTATASDQAASRDGDAGDHSPAAESSGTGEASDPKAAAKEGGDRSVGPVELAFVGDVMFGRYDETGFVINPADPSTAFTSVAHLIRDADIAVANLETPLLREPFPKSPWYHRLRFAAGPEAARALAEAGFDGVSLANNHAFDMRNRGVEDTPKLLEENGLFAVGKAVPKGEAPFRVVSAIANGQKIAFIGVTAVRNSVDGPDVPSFPYAPDEETLLAAAASVVREARASHDRVIVLAHWGVAGEDAPRYPRQKAARGFIDAGADAVIGHHPHVLQGMELYNNGLIVHSLGDFLFDKLFEKRRLTGVLRVGFTPGGVCPSHVTFYPVVSKKTMEGIFPFIPGKVPRRAVVWRVMGLSRPMGTQWRGESGSGPIRMALPTTCK